MRAFRAPKPAILVRERRGPPEQGQPLSVAISAAPGGVV